MAFRSFFDKCPDALTWSKRWCTVLVEGQPIGPASALENRLRSLTRRFHAGKVSLGGNAYASETVVLLHRGGFKIESLLVDGLDWETADRYRDHAADPETQRLAAEAYDGDATNWQMRVGVAQEVVSAGLDAMQRELNQVAQK